MSLVGDATGLLGLLEKAWIRLQERLDPARAQAKRLIEAFEAYGVARQQIPRLLPASLKLPNATFSTPDKLKDKITPELLDWAGEYLVIKRRWLDGGEQHRHEVKDHYKAPAGYREWLEGRIQATPGVSRYITVWKPAGQEIPVGIGPLCLIYEETSEGLDATEFTRYWLLSDHWRMEHAPCLENLLAVIAVARSLGISVLGSDIPMKQLEKLESGMAFIPDVAKYRCGSWHPEDLIDPLPGADTQWRKELWSRAQSYLAKSGIGVSEARLEPPADNHPGRPG